MLSCLIDQNTTIILCKLRRKIAKGTCQQMSLHFASLGQSLWSTMHTYFREEKRWKFGSGCKINLRRPCFAKQGSQPLRLHQNDVYGNLTCAEQIISAKVVLNRGMFECNCPPGPASIGLLVVEIWPRKVDYFGHCVDGT